MEKSPDTTTGCAEDFFATIATTIRYVRYTPGIKVILIRVSLFSFFISIIPALMPVVGLKELHLDPSRWDIFSQPWPWARSRDSVHYPACPRPPLSKQLTICADLLLIIACFSWPLSIGPTSFCWWPPLGSGMDLSASELWIAGQRAMPDWARGRMNAAIIMVSQAATALGGVVWGDRSRERRDSHLSWGRCSGYPDDTRNPNLHRKAALRRLHGQLNLEPAAVTIFSHDWDPARLSQGKHRFRS